ncbi:MAG: helix-turn-helix transcriptional regulator [Anaeromyxobacter sp.]
MHASAFPAMLRRWRTTRRLSQESLALDADVSTRHLSYLETGKARPSRDMVLQLSAALGLDLRERNVLLGSAGFAAAYGRGGLDSLALGPIRRAVELLLAQQEPWGAVLLDRCWNVLQANGGAARLFAHFLEPGLPPEVAGNLVRAGLHPQGLRGSMVNWEALAAISLERLTRECALHPDDDARRALLDEVRRYPGVREVQHAPAALDAPVAIVHLRRGASEVRLFTLLTTLGTPLDETAQELVIETFFPADEATERFFRRS